MEFLPQQNKRNQGDVIPADVVDHWPPDKDVIVIGGGDTGSDCTGTSNRHGAKSVTQFELLPQPPDLGYFPRANDRPAALAVALLDDDAPHEHVARRRLRPPLQHPHEGIQRRRRRQRARASSPARSSGTKRTASTSSAKCRAPKRNSPANSRCWRWASSAPRRPARSAISAWNSTRAATSSADAEYRTSVDGVFAAGDLRRGQSLVVWAIHEGREAARAVDKHLMGVTHLPSTNAGDFAAR